MTNQSLLEHVCNFFSGIFSSFFKKERDSFFKDNFYIIENIRKHEKTIKSYRDDAFPNIIKEYREKVQDNQLTIEDIIVPIFAMVSEASSRTLGKRFYDVQFAGGLGLQGCNVVEMKTGEGKTLVATLPAVLYAMKGKSVHVVTVNDYLAKRDAEILRPIYNFLGLTVGYIQEDSSQEQRREAYDCDIVYGSNNQFAFDFLKDNLVRDINEKIQRDRCFAIIDEVDNILIDEARTPLIISAPGEDPENYYDIVNEIMYDLQQNVHYKTNNKSKNAFLTSKGWEIVVDFLANNGIKDIFNKNIYICHYIRNSLKAHKAMTLNKDYVVLKDEIVIIDEFTGRLAKGRRYSNGLHQAIEAKERVKIKKESTNQASISYTAFYKSYDYLCGMTGTAINDVDEFNEIYNLDIVPIPTNRPIKRKDFHGVRLYRSKIESLIDTAHIIKEAIGKQQPVLVCTSSVDESIALANVLQEHQIEFNLLNATNHEKEAYIVAQAGRPGKVTVSTNMAGRGTDIPLGGDLNMAVQEVLTEQENADEEKIIELMAKRCTSEKKTVLEAGGLFVIILGTPDSKKTETQIIGRSGRQGDIGQSIKIYSLEDEIILPLYQDKINSIMLDYYFPKDKKFTITDKGNEFISNLQNEYQAHFRDNRKNSYKYEQEFNKQREVYYQYRDYLLTINDKDLHIVIVKFLHELIKNDVTSVNNLFKDVNFEDLETFNKFQIPIENYSTIEDRDYGQYFQYILSNIDMIEEDRLRNLILEKFDNKWFSYLVECSNLNSTNILNYYKNRDPLQEFNETAIKLFESFINKSMLDILGTLVSSTNKQQTFNFGESDVDDDIEKIFKNLLESTNNLDIDEEFQEDISKTDESLQDDTMLDDVHDSTSNPEPVEPNN